MDTPPLIAQLADRLAVVQIQAMNTSARDWLARFNTIADYAIHSPR